MKYFFAIATALAGLALATPVRKRQNIDFAAYDAVPVLPDIAAPAGDVPPAQVTYAPSVVASAAAAAATEAVIIGGADAAVSAVSKRSVAEVVKRNACDPRAAGNGPTAVPDTPQGFQAYSAFSGKATGAVTPVGYQSIVTSGNAAAQDSTYMTYKMMSSYDPNACATFCQSQQGCNSFNIFYERDPIVEPGTGCDNPPSLTYIKCSIFGGMLNTASAQNVGQWQDNFHVVIAGSNIYVATAPKIPSGYTSENLGNATINAPGGYMGVQTFPQSQPYDPSVCAAACAEKSNYNMQNGVPSAGNPDVCNFFVAYVLYKNGQNGVFTCTYYTTALSKVYATNVGQYDSAGNHYTIGSANSFASITSRASGNSNATGTASSTSASPSPVPTSTMSTSTSVGFSSSTSMSASSCAAPIATQTITATATITASSSGTNTTVTSTQYATVTATTTIQSNNGINTTVTSTQYATITATTTTIQSNSGINTTVTQTQYATTTAACSATPATVTTTTTTTTTAAIINTPTPTNYRISATFNTKKNPTKYYLQDAVTGGYNSNNPHFLQMGADVYSGSIFQFSADNRLVLPLYGGLYSEQSATSGYNIIYFSTKSDAAAYPTTYFTLNADMSVTVTNPVKGTSFLQGCYGSTTYLAVYATDQGCTPITLKAELA